MTTDDYETRLDKLEKKQGESDADLAEIRALAAKVEKDSEKAVDWLWQFVDIINNKPRHGLVFARAQEAIGPCKTAQVRGRSWRLLYKLVFGESLSGVAFDGERDIVINRVSVLLERNSTMRLTLKLIAESQHLDECTSTARTVLERYQYMDGMVAKRVQAKEDLESEITRLKIEKESYYAQAEHYRPYLQLIAKQDHIASCTMAPELDHCQCPCFVAAEALKEAP